MWGSFHRTPFPRGHGCKAMKTINHTQVVNELERHISNFRNKGITASQALEIFQDFFFNFEVEGFSKESDRDMALFQCGIYDWGKGEKFETDFVRQLSFEDENGEYEGMKQLHLTLFYNPALSSKKEVDFNVWFNVNKGGKEWIDTVKSSKGFSIVKDMITQDFSVVYEEV